MIDFGGIEKEVDKIEEYYCQIEKEQEKYCHFFDQKVVETIPSKIFTEEGYKDLREYCVFRMGFSVVTKENCRVLAQIIKDNNVLEVMAGLGSYTATLRELGVNVIATDDMSWMDYDTSKYKNWKKYSWIKDLESLDAVEAINKYGKDVGFILMSWPPQNESYALDALLAMRRVNSECRMIYIGEKKGGCTANNDFFDEMIDISNEFDEIKKLRQSYRVWENNGYYDMQFIVR